MTASSSVQIEVHAHPEDAEEALRTDVRLGLASDPKTLPPKWFYDERGSQLFDEITRLPEYYLTRAERTILTTVADEIVEQAHADTLVELGSGTAEKTRLLLRAFEHAGNLTGYIPFDVSEEFLRASAHAVADEHPGIHVHGVVGDFDRHIPLLPREGTRMVAFLGSTIGNYPPKARHGFFATIADELEAGDSFLLGFDLVKDTGRLEAAYNDAAGVTAEFNRNVLAVLNARLGADFEPDRFRHLAIWNHDDEWIEMRLRAEDAMNVRIDALGLDVHFGAGEEIQTEVSAKFRRERLETELADVGLAATGWWTDPADDFAMLLARPA